MSNPSARPSPRILLVSNRLPVTIGVDEGRAVFANSSGGLAAGLRHVHREGGGRWVGWPGDVSALPEAERERVTSELTERRCIPLYLSSTELSQYYDGFSNGVLWPLFHYLLDRIPPTAQQWSAYRAVNERFADATVAAWSPGDLIWVHDYHLMLVPQLLRQRLPGARIGFFLHIPFPTWEVLRTLPWREEVLQGILGADLVGFHTYAYQGHFAQSVLHVLGLAAQSDRVNIEGRSVRLGVFPIGVDAPAVTALARDPGVEREVSEIRAEANGKRILLGIDRLDYTKGIPQRLLAFERLLEREPSLRGQVRLVQIAVPSRDQVPSYQEFTRQLDELVGRINGAYSAVGWIPIHYVHRSLTEAQVVALYRAADVMLVTPVRDGLNLVAKEFVCSRLDGDGVLVLSELAGAAAEMGEALQVNPYDIDGMAAAYTEAITMPAEERQVRMRALQERISTHDVHHWVRSFVEALGEPAEESARAVVLSSKPELDTLAAQLCGSPRLLLLLDYDGTLVPFARSPELAAPDRELRDLLAATAARPGVSVHIVSGRTRQTLDRWLGDLPIGLHAEHGFASRLNRGDPWVEMAGIRDSWKAAARPVFERLTTRTPGALIEEKAVSLAWHWRMVEPELGEAHAAELMKRLEGLLQSEPIEWVRNDKSLELRPRGVHKGKVVERVLATTSLPLPTIAAMGNDTTDDDLFRALPPESIAVSVGFRPSTARYRVARPRGARALLTHIAHGR